MIRIIRMILLLFCTLPLLACLSVADSAPETINGWPTSLEALLENHTPSDLHSLWKGIPVISKADAGMSIDPDTYVYAVRISMEEAEQYYQKQMRRDGWQLTSRQWTRQGVFGGSLVQMNFHRERQSAQILFADMAGKEYILVKIIQTND